MALPSTTIMNTLSIDDLLMRNALNHPDHVIHPLPYVSDNTNGRFGLHELQL
jgi:hypothetical protein